ncbi:synapse differentiation-inducing gene protein 1-like [Corticium candelabrum]|uniref:synapse differentiation-inducing gene protein 1-like n=1 Tax=Corticium candelabrum TaxID=121492 RepID=UPI002E26870D|nr:synapse differentiation-inducing gene protein 1-like [Corticium candelabrum]
MYPERHQVVTDYQARDYFGLSIFTLLCCCLPIGIFALLNSMKVREANASGDEFSATQASATARRLNLVGIISGVVFMVIVAVVVLVVDLVSCSRDYVGHKRC